MKTRSLLIVLAISCLAFCGQAQVGRPLKVGVRAQVQSANSDVVEVRIVLLDARNSEVRANKDMLITVMAISMPHDTAFQAVSIRAGQGSQRVSFPIRTSGLMSFRAKQRELMEGGMYLRVTKRRGGAMLESRTRLIYALERFAPPPAIELVYSPERTLLADGRDSAVVQAILLDEEMATSDIRITLVADGGKLNPNILIIPAGKDQAEAVLTSTKQGTIKVRFSHSHPAVTVVGSAVLLIKFGPPITRLMIMPSPKSIALVDNGELIAQLTDELGTPIATDHFRDVSFVIDQGRGKLQPFQIRIDSSKSQARTKLYPTWIGEVKLTSFTENLAPSSATMEIKFPLLLTIISIIGGALGGLVAAWVAKIGYFSRSGVGIVTGFILYWGILFGLLGEQLPLQVLLNPFMGMILAISGGWAGTKVFEPMLRKFGVTV